MNMQFVPQRDFCSPDRNILRRRLLSHLGLEAPHAAGDKVSGECVDLRSGVRLVALQRSRAQQTRTSIHIHAQISEGGPLRQSVFLRKDHISLLGIEQLMTAVVRTGLWKVAGRVCSGDWGPQGMNYDIDLQEWHTHVDSDLQCASLTIRQDSAR